MTTNNDTPQVFSEGTRDDGPFGREWRGEADGADPPGGFPDGPAGAAP